MLENGVMLLLGGEILDFDGYFYLVMVLEDVLLGMFVYDDELFGLVVLFICVCDDK